MTTGQSRSTYFGYTEVLAVADGIVAGAVGKLSEPTVPITFDNEAGNYIAIDLGGRQFAFYEHLQPGSVRVKVGDRVRSGDVLARIGHREVSSAGRTCISTLVMRIHLSRPKVSHSCSGTSKC